MIRNLRYAFRSLRKSPGYTAPAVLTLALGIGANTAIFSALNGVVLEPLPFPEPDGLVVVALYNRSLKSGTYAAYPDFLDWQRQARSFEQISAFLPAGFDVTHPGAPEHVDGDEISSGFFNTLGVKLAAGRSFNSDEDAPGGGPAAVITYRFWQGRFHGSLAAIGKPLTLNGESFTVVGVLPPGFHFEERAADVYTPIARGNPLFRNDRTVHDLLCLARLAKGVGIGQARAEMNALQESIDKLNPTTEKGQGVSIVSLKQELVGDVGAVLALLLGAISLVLLIACANVANLLLARAAARTREFAVRRALGANQGQIVQQLINESLLVSLVGGVAGLGFAKCGLSLILAVTPGNLPRAGNIGVNTSVLLFALGVSVATGILFGLVPALEQANRDLQTGLKAGGRGSTAGHRRTAGLLAVVQIALALVLLSGAGLLFRTVRSLWAVDPGFATEHIITFKVGLSPLKTATAAVTRALYRQVSDGLNGIQGVESADLTALVPLGRGDNSGPFWLGAHQPASMSEIPRAIYYPTGPDYARTMRIPLLRGRYLEKADDIHAELVCVIDSVLAHTYFPDRDPIGQTLTIPHWGAAHAVGARIVGVVGHVRQYGLDGAGGGKPQIYYSFYQLPDEGLPIFRDEVTFAVRTSLDAAAVLPAIRRFVYAANGNQPIYDVRTMLDLVSGSIAKQRFPMILLAAFAVVALLLATVGVYGVVSYSTAQRIPEIGIRMALGAQKRSVLRMLIGQGLRLALVGVGMGAVSAAVLARVLLSFSHLLYGVSATDPLTFSAASFCLIVAALLACYFPARRAASLDPMMALRHD